MCIAEGFPALPFFVNQDISREDGIIQCTHLTPAETLRFGWRVARAISILVRFIG